MTYAPLNDPPYPKFNWWARRVRRKLTRFVAGSRGMSVACCHCTRKPPVEPRRIASTIWLIPSRLSGAPLTVASTSSEKVVEIARNDCSSVRASKTSRIWWMDQSESEHKLDAWLVVCIIVNKGGGCNMESEWGEIS